MNNLINDCFVEVTGERPTEQQIESISNKLASSIKYLAKQWGWDDTEVRDFTYSWLVENIGKI